jgi:hypothetical protein
VVIYHWLTKEKGFFQTFIPKLGWSFYSTEGEFMMTAPEYNTRPMRPIKNEGEFIGIVYNLREAVNMERNYNRGYLLFNGLRLEGLDTLSSLTYDSDDKKYFADYKGWTYIFNEEGTQLGRYKDISGHTLGLWRVKKENGYNLCNTDYSELLEDDYSRLERENGVYIGTKNEQKYLIRVAPKIQVSKAYTKIHTGGKLCIGEMENGLKDIYNYHGEIILENVNFIKRKRPYAIVRAEGIEYWMTYGGIIYAQHQLTD